MDGAALTAAYLADVRSSCAPVAELAGDRETGRSLFRSHSPQIEFLTRPLFASRPEVYRLHADTELVRRVVTSLPERRFGGSVTAFAQAVGAQGYQVTAAGISRSDPASPQGRADLYQAVTDWPPDPPGEPADPDRLLPVFPGAARSSRDQLRSA